MTTDDVEQAASLVGKILAAIGASYAGWRFLLPRFVRHWASYCAAHDISREFGPKAGSIIKSAIIDLEKQKNYSQAMIEALTKSSDLGVYICDSDGLCLTVNLVLENWLGMSREKACGYGWLAAIVDAEKAHHTWTWSVKNGTPYRDEYTIRNAQTGELIPAFTETVRIGTTNPVHVGFVRRKTK